MVPVAAARPAARHPVLLLVLFLVGCAAVAAAATLGLGAVWQEVHDWVTPHVADDRAVGADTA